MKKLLLYIHGKGGNAEEAQRYKALFEGCDVLGLDYSAQTPWEAKEEFPRLLDALRGDYEAVTLIANSIGAYFAMHSLSDRPIEQAFFISPVVDMEKLITDMMGWAAVSQEELRQRGQIETAFGESLSWKYLSYVREHPIRWTAPTHILYGEKDNLCAYETVSAFAQRQGASLTVLKGGEHWFHTKEQLRFLDQWIKELLR